jgi:hypothetical protein
VIVVRDAGSVLVHAHDGGIDHLHRRVMTTIASMIRSRQRTKRLQQVVRGTYASGRSLQGAPEPIVNMGNATRLVREQRPDGSPFKVSECIPHDSRRRFGRLKHVHAFNQQNRTIGTSEITP